VSVVLIIRGEYVSAQEPMSSPVQTGTGAKPSRRYRLFAGLAALSLLAAACGGGGTGTAVPSQPAVVPPASGDASTPPMSSPDTSPSASSPDGSPSASGDPGVDAGVEVTLEPPATGGALTLWNPFTGPDGTFFSSLVDDFNSETPQCQTTVATQPGAEYIARLEAAAAGNQLPHIIAAGYDALPGLTENGIVTPVDDFAEQAGLSAEQFPEAIWNAGLWKDQRVGVPIDTHPMVFFYNKSLFEEAGLDPETPPADRESFEAAIQAINDETEADGYQMVSSGPGANFLVGIQFATLFYQGGGEWTSDDFSEATFNSEAGVQAAEYLASLVNDHGVPTVESDAEIIAFAQGTNAMVWSGIWESTRYSEALGDDLGVAPVPEIFGPGVWGGSHNMAVTAAADADPELRACAYYFMDWFSAHSMEWAAGGQVPARTAVRESEALQNATEGLLPIIAQVTPLADSVQFLPTIPGGGDLLFVGQGAGEAATLVIGGMDAQEALDAAAEFNSEVLRTNKERYDY
jgi:multiple sugar transport system substrate-binding protein